MVILGIISTVIRALLRTSLTTDPYLDNVVLSLRMESTDPYYNQVVLLMHMEDTGLTDVKGHTINLVGNTARSATQSKFGGYSAYFDGVGDCLTSPDSADFNFGSGDFTIECWVNTPLTQDGTPIGKRDNGTSAFATTIYTTGSVCFRGNFSTWNDLLAQTPVGTIQANTWAHIAWVRSSTSLYIFVNGVLRGSSNIGSGTLADASFPLQIGRADNVGENSFLGYIDDLRITKGVARYTKSFSVPTAAFPEPANTAIDDTGKTVTTYGNAKFSGVSKYGSGSFYFDGAGDYLTVPDGAEWSFGTGDFTVEAWVRFDSSNPTVQTICSQFDTSSNWWFFRKEDNTTNKLSLYFIIGGTVKANYIMTSSWSSWAADTWYHLAMVRSGVLMYIFIDGASQTLTATVPVSTNDMGNIASPLYIGSDTTYALKGYIDDLRITKGVARYTSNFTPYKILTTAPAGDPLYNYTTLLLKMNGTNGGTTFTDNSYSPKTITVNGNTNTSTAQLKYGTASGYFDGTGDYLTTPYSSDFDFGARDFTIELWLYKTANNANGSRIWNANGDYYHQVEIGINASGNLICYMTSNGTSWNLVSASNIATLSNNTWYHIAIVRNGGTALAFINGTIYALSSGLSTTALVNGTSGSTTRSIGGQAGIDRSFAGYIDDFRITNGFARYTAAFQPPGPHIAAIDPDTDQWWLNTVLAMRMDGTHGSTTFTDLKGKTVTAYGNASISSAVSKFGQAGYFDGTTDGMSIPSSTDFDFGSGDYTLECWINLNAITTTELFIRRSAATWAPFGLYVDGTGLGFSGSTTGSSWDIAIIGTTAVSTGVWHHAALTRYGNVYTLWLDGTACGTTTVSGALMASTSPVYIGCDFDQAYSINGYLDDVRITKGIARYTAAFTPSEKPLPTYVVGPDHDQYWDKVVLACPFDSSLEDARTKAVTAYGNAAISSSQRMFGARSAYFDGTGDYITYPDSTDWDFTTSFTIEFWCYVTAFDTDGTLFIMQQSGATYGGFEFYADSYGTLYFRRSDAILVVTSATGVLTAGSWKHLAATWDGTTYRVFVDGIIVGSGSSASAPANVTGVLRIGTYVGTSTYDLNGYIDDLRITKDVARYTANFEPPIVANILG